MKCVPIIYCRDRTRNTADWEDAEFGKLLRRVVLSNSGLSAWCDVQFESGTTQRICVDASRLGVRRVFSGEIMFLVDWDPNTGQVWVSQSPAWYAASEYEHIVERRKTMEAVRDGTYPTDRWWPPIEEIN